MTKEEVYDLALKLYQEPAVFTFGSEVCLGYWIKKSEATTIPLMLTTETMGVVLVEVASSWEALAKKAGLLEKRVADEGKSNGVGNAAAKRVSHDTGN